MVEANAINRQLVSASQQQAEQYKANKASRATYLPEAPINLFGFGEEIAFQQAQRERHVHSQLDIALNYNTQLTDFGALLDSNNLSFSQLSLNDLQPEEPGFFRTAWNASTNFIGNLAEGAFNVVYQPIAQAADLAELIFVALPYNTFSDNTYNLTGFSHVSQTSNYSDSFRAAFEYNLVGGIGYGAYDSTTAFRAGDYYTGTLNLVGTIAGIFGAKGLRFGDNVLAPFASTSRSLFVRVPDSSLVADEVAALSRIKANAEANLNLNQRINAKAIQVDSGYNADVWKTGRLNEGDVIYSLSPNPNPKFFTSLETLQASKFDSSGVSRALQIEEHQLRGYRVDVTGYRAKQSFDLPYGKTRANPQFGPGGGDQYLIFDHNKYLEPITTIDIKW